MFRAMEVMTAIAVTREQLRRQVRATSIQGLRTASLSPCRRVSTMPAHAGRAPTTKSLRGRLLRLQQRLRMQREKLKRSVRLSDGFERHAHRAYVLRDGREQ